MLATTSGLSQRLGLNTCGRACTVRAFYWPSHLPGPGILPPPPFFLSDVQSPGTFSIKNQLLYARCFLSFVMRGSWTSWICWLINSPGISQRVELSCPIFAVPRTQALLLSTTSVPKNKESSIIALAVRKEPQPVLQQIPQHTQWKRRLWALGNSLAFSHYWNANPPQ